MLLTRSVIKIVFRYIKYFVRAKNKNSVHDPFVFDLYTKVILADKNFYAFEDIAAVRSMLEKNKTEINVTDFGTGSQAKNNNRKQKISDIAKNAAKKEKIGKLLTALCDYFQPETAMELGTSFGISTLYQYSGMKQAQWITFEGCRETSKIAKKVFQSCQANGIKVIVGDFNQTLSNQLEKVTDLDYVFFDGNHQKQPTIEYFELCLKKSHEGTLFVFDDIHWSKDMEQAWKYIQNHPSVTVTIDLFWLGLVFFRKELPKENYTLSLP